MIRVGTTVLSFLLVAAGPFAVAGEAPVIDDAVQVRTLPGAKWCYLAHTGPYWTVGPRLEQVRSHHPGSALADRRVFVRYLDDPRICPPSRLRAEIGRRSDTALRTDTPMQLVNADPLVALALPMTQSPDSLRRLLPVLESQARARGLVPVAPPVEVYEFDELSYAPVRAELWLPVTAYPLVFDPPAPPESAGPPPSAEDGARSSVYSAPDLVAAQASVSALSAPAGTTAPAGHPPSSESSPVRPTSAAAVLSEGAADAQAVGDGVPPTVEHHAAEPPVRLGDPHPGLEVAARSPFPSNVGGIHDEPATLGSGSAAPDWARTIEPTVEADPGLPGALSCVDRFLPADPSRPVDCAWVAQVVLRIRALGRAAAADPDPNAGALADLARALDDRFRQACYVDAKTLAGPVQSSHKAKDPLSSARSDLLRQIDRLLAQRATGSVNTEAAVSRIRALLDHAGNLVFSPGSGGSPASADQELP